MAAFELEDEVRAEVHAPGGSSGWGLSLVMRRVGLIAGEGIWVRSEDKVWRELRFEGRSLKREGQDFFD